MLLMQLPRRQELVFGTPMLARLRRADRRRSQVVPVLENTRTTSRLCGPERGSVQPPLMERWNAGQAS